MQFITPASFTTAFPLPPARPEGKKAHRERVRKFKARVRRTAQLRAASDVLPHLPAEGESVHTLLTGTFDFMLVLTCVIQSRPCRCDHLRVTTLAFSRRNVEELAKLLDSGLVCRLALLCSDFHAKSNRSLYDGAVGELVTARGQTVSYARCHAKVACLAFADGMRLTFEGSANLRTNKNTEQMACVNDAGLHDWHAAWIDEKIAGHGEKHKGRN